ncbi:MAG: hypothetical protein M1836_008050 [Candelina mexicana]|nr:MAG: hypothetical protein M1836_008050 [Candelina mexicana]
MPSLNTIAKVLLPFFSLAAIYGCWVLSFRNGTFDRISHIREVGPRNLPNTDQPIVGHYTGISAVDDQLDVLVLFFWGIVDGSYPDLSLQSFYGGGQFAAVWTIIMLEGLRVGNQWRFIAFTAIWGLIMQNIAFGITIPLYLTLHLLTSPTTLASSSKPPSAEAASSLIAHPAEFRILPFSVLLGVIVPSILMCLPAPHVVTFERKQLFVIIWQAFPLWISLWQFCLSTLLSVILGPGASFRSAAERKAGVLHALRHTYVFAFTVSSVTHIAGLTLSITSLLCPAIFAPAYPPLFHPFRIFVPMNPFSSAKVSSIGEGSLSFLQYDIWIGCAASILWAAVLNRNAHKETMGLKGWLDLLAKVLCSILLAGPGSALVALMWSRDELVLVDVEEMTSKKRN